MRERKNKLEFPGVAQVSMFRGLSLMRRPPRHRVVGTECRQDIHESPYPAETLDESRCRRILAVTEANAVFPISTVFVL
ncbi:hypothetical protein RRSWK_01255 [Rhodopirellula sp. SWK7]|nr:hypothetical protein RRSWK_01255 [Rhodopirellula sp. SWK7]